MVISNDGRAKAVTSPEKEPSLHDTKFADKSHDMTIDVLATSGHRRFPVLVIMHMTTSWIGTKFETAAWTVTRLGCIRP